MYYTCSFWEHVFSLKDHVKIAGTSTLEDVVQWLGGDIWSPQVMWSNPEQDYVCLRAAPGTISSIEKKSL